MGRDLQKRSFLLIFFFIPLSCADLEGKKVDRFSLGNLAVCVQRKGGDIDIDINIEIDINIDTETDTEKETKRAMVRL